MVAHILCLRQKQNDCEILKVAFGLVLGDVELVNSSLVQVLGP